MRANRTEQDRACATAWYQTCISNRYMGCMLLEELSGSSLTTSRTTGFTVQGYS